MIQIQYLTKLLLHHFYKTRTNLMTTHNYTADAAAAAAADSHDS